MKWLMAATTAAILIGAQPASAQQIPLEDSKVALRLSHLKGVDTLEVVAGKGWHTNTLTDWICVFASRRSRGVKLEEKGCIEEDALEGVSYDFDHLDWTATATANIPTRVNRVSHIETSKGRRLVYDRVGRSHASIRLEWHGLGDIETEPWVSTPGCYLTVICPHAGVTRYSAAKVSGSIVLEGVGRSIDLQTERGASMRWRIRI